MLPTNMLPTFHQQTPQQVASNSHWALLGSSGRHTRIHPPGHVFLCCTLATRWREACSPERSRIPALRILAIYIMHQRGTHFADHWDNGGADGLAGAWLVFWTLPLFVDRPPTHPLSPPSFILPNRFASKHPGEQNYIHLIQWSANYPCWPY